MDQISRLSCSNLLKKLSTLIEDKETLETLAGKNQILSLDY